MPELPEVQTIAGELNSLITGKHLNGVTQLYPGIVRVHKAGLLPATVTGVNRRGKYLLIQANPALIVVHLRMTGKFVPAGGTHIRAEFNFSDNTTLYFSDIRTFGKIDIYPAGATVPALQKLGPEPLQKNFTALVLQANLGKRTVPIKNALLNQQVVAGLGNIYVCEILYLSGIDPWRPANSLNKAELQTLVKHTKAVLKKAIKHNGTTISDYRRVDEKSGEFQNFLQVYQKQACPKGHKVERQKMAGRSTYWCPQCQHNN